jgi:protein O-mannosyl-transferase
MNQKKKKPASKAVPAGKPPIAKTIPAGKPMILSLILAAFAVLIYANTIGHNYALDDIAVVYQNKYTMKGLSGILEMLTTCYWQG